VSDYRITVQGEHVGTLIQGKHVGEVTLWAPSRAEAVVIVDQLGYPGGWKATVERRDLDESKPKGQRFVALTFEYHAAVTAAEGERLGLVCTCQESTERE